MGRWQIGSYANQASPRGSLGCARKLRRLGYAALLSGAWAVGCTLNPWTEDPSDTDVSSAEMPGENPAFVPAVAGEPVSQPGVEVPRTPAPGPAIAQPSGPEMEPGTPVDPSEAPPGEPVAPVEPQPALDAGAPKHHVRDGADAGVTAKAKSQSETDSGSMSRMVASPDTRSAQAVAVDGGAAEDD